VPTVGAGTVPEAPTPETVSIPLFRVDQDGTVAVVAEDLKIPNGMVVTPDGTTLIVAETFGNRLTAFDIADDGSLSGRRVFADLGERRPDGICLDAEGAVWVGSFATSEYVRVREGGEVAQIIETPGRWAVSCVLGGPDGNDLYCTTVELEIADYLDGRGHGRIERARVDVPGPS
jgi:sugar lactone lactonase YvrE